MHICGKYGNCMTNYALKMAMPMCIWFENHESSYMISLLLSFSFKLCQNSSLAFFLRSSTYKRTPCKRFAFFDIFFIIFDFFSKRDKSYCRRFLKITAGSTKATTGGCFQEPPVVSSFYIPVVGTYYRWLSSKTTGRKYL